MREGKYRRQSIAATSILAVSFLLLVGSTTSQAAVTAAPKVTILSSTNSMSAGPLLYLDATGESPKFGVDLSFKYVLNNPAVLAALLSGSADVAAIGCQGVLDAGEQGVPLVIIAALTTASHELVLSKSAAAKAQQAGVTPKSSWQDRIKALKGLKIATSPAGTTTNAFFTSIVQLVGLKPGSDVTILPASNPTAMAAGIKTGSYDGAYYGSGLFGDIIADGSAVHWLFGPEIPQINGIPTFCLVTKESWAKAYPGSVFSIYRAISYSINKMKNARSTAEPVVKAKFFPDTNQNSSTAHGTLLFLHIQIVVASPARAFSS